MDDKKKKYYSLKFWDIIYSDYKYNMSNNLDLTNSSRSLKKKQDEPIKI